LIGDWRKLQNEQLHTSDFSPNVRVIKSTADHVAYMGEMGNVYRVLVTEHEWNRSPGRSRHRWLHGIRIDQKEMLWRLD
jgi:hypothetical protein